MKNTIFIFLLFLTCVCSIQAQSRNDTFRDSIKKYAIKDSLYQLDGEYFLDFKFAYHQQKSAYMEVGMYLGMESHLSSWGGGIFYGPSVSMEMFLKSTENKKSIVGPKIGFEVYNANLLGGLWGARCNVAYYTDGINNSVKLLPEFGLSMWSFVNIFYGYNIPLSNKSLVDNNGHKFTLMINIPVRSRKYKKWRR